jgi:flagellar hook-basal body complex protein FliE
MTIEPLIPDVAPGLPQQDRPADASVFAKMVEGAGSALQAAQHAEDAFAAGAGDLQRAIYERARADVALSVATAAAQRAVQALQSILNMQV